MFNRDFSFNKLGHEGKKEELDFNSSFHLVVLVSIRGIALFTRSCSSHLFAFRVHFLNVRRVRCPVAGYRYTGYNETGQERESLPVTLLVKYVLHD